MNINYTARHTDITAEVKKYCERRIKSLEKFLGYGVDVDVILGVEKYRHKVEVNVRTKKSTLNAIEETQDMISSLNLAFDNIEKRAKKGREKQRDRRRKTREKPPSLPLEALEQERRKIVNDKDYSHKPMTLEEAVLQFDYKKKRVFVFRRMDSERWSVLYQRKDGNLGLIELD
ncbi:MAG: ribosome-associated translation inhibitor RaiA [Candidatus Aminicenantes bacterium]|nr:ribosome-associated translation inhibitor RaiA [Candidatus Aminicenantes bacterium]